MRSIFLSLVTAALSLTGCSQNQTKNQPGNNEIHVGGRCEGCQGVYESSVAFEKLTWIDTLPDFNDAGPQIELSGIIFKPDGKTPAKNVILYVYHTDQTGVYPKKGNETGTAKQHGFIRGWIRTNEKGEYKFYTLVPASYPNSRNPKHIHPTIKEEGFSEYWIDEFLFADDPLLPDEERNRKHPVGGSGILKTRFENGMLRASRNIILGLNVQDYPK